MRKEKIIICDANILIDYCNADKQVLEKVSIYSKFIVPDIILAEVNQLSEMEASEFGITVIPVPIEVLAKAGETLQGCSLQDTVCFILAHKNNWICATNDSKLRKECLNNGIEVVRGLKLIAELVETGLISKRRAKTIANKISETNREISSKILEDFYDLLPE